MSATFVAKIAARLPRPLGCIAWIRYRFAPGTPQEKAIFPGRPGKLAGALAARAPQAIAMTAIVVPRKHLTRSP